eukprot:TRINITY_DN20264_c0_g1_i1.p1 TRINITY_DN20264_c0_g1~~TRINITY_DN20264_c0_g1_i1.p1  ORF type:complete len:291 (+),score=21.93 TRINITY_DN20264_c0_g1_i1:24-875(+)
MDFPDPFLDAQEIVNSMFKTVTNKNNTLMRLRQADKNSHRTIEESQRCLTEIARELSALDENVQQLSQAVIIAQKERIRFKLDNAELSRRNDYVNSCSQRLQSLVSSVNNTASTLGQLDHWNHVYGTIYYDTSDFQQKNRDPLDSIKAKLGTTTHYNNHPTGTHISSSGNDFDLEANNEPHDPYAQEHKTLEEMEQEQDEAMEDVQHGVKRLNKIATDIGDELVVHDKLMDELDQEVVTLGDKLAVAQKKVEKVLNEMNSRGKIAIIALLVVLMIVLIFLLFK